MFGRVTSLGYYTDRSSRAEATIRYKWSDPWTSGRESSYDFEVAMEDRNHDGRWDTWMEPTGETNNGDPVLVIRADTILDGEPDFEARGNASTLESSYRVIESQRGF